MSLFSKSSKYNLEWEVTLLHRNGYKDKVKVTAMTELLALAEARSIHGSLVKYVGVRCISSKKVA